MAQAGPDHLLTTTRDGVAYPDPGLTTDVVLSLVATGQQDSARPLVSAISDPATLASYIGDGRASLSVGPTAKLIVALNTFGADPSDVHDRNLRSELTDQLSDSGRVLDLGPDDWSTTESQSWSVLALSSDEAGQDDARSAARYLATQQCEDGGFPVVLEPPTCTGDTAATAFATSALAAAGEMKAAQAGAEWLSRQAVVAGDGRFWRSSLTGQFDVGTSAAAVTALQDVGGHQLLVDQGRKWLAEQQVTTGEDAGAFRLDGWPDPSTTARAAIALAAGDAES